MPHKEKDPGRRSSVIMFRGIPDAATPRNEIKPVLTLFISRLKASEAASVP